MKALSKFAVLALLLGMPMAALAEGEASVKITPYGFVQLSGYFDANTFTAKDYPGQVAKAQSGGAFLMSARYSRFGVKLAVDDPSNWTGAKLGGGLEFDFKAGQIATGTDATGKPTAPSTTWYNGVMRLRLAFVTADWKTDYGTWQVLGGQHYGLVAPLFATSITWTADPLFWMAGNTWRRAPQARLTYTGGENLLGLNAAVAVLSPQTADGTSPDFGSGNASRTPSVEGRVGINTKLEGVSVAAGVGYLTGKRRVANAGAAGQLDIDGTELAVDLALGSKWADVKGEWFTQKGAGDTYNGITPGIGGPAGTSQVAGESSGYWAQAVLKPIPELWVHVGYGVETIKDSKATAIALAAAARKENSQVAGGVIVNAGKYWKFGVEVCQTTSKYADNVKQDGLQTAVSTQLTF